MTFLLDHCVWRETGDFLHKAGFKCLTLRGVGDPGASNGEVIALAQKHKAVLITRDSDFSNLGLYPPGSHLGIIFLRITPDTIDDVHNLLLQALRNLPQDEYQGNLLIITSTTYRLHKAQ